MATYTYTEKQIDNYGKFLNYLENVIGSTDYKTITSTSYDDVTKTLTITSSAPFADDTTFNAIVNAYTNAYTPPPKKTYSNQVFNPVSVQESDWRTIFSWSYNGVDNEPDISGVLFTSRIDANPDDTQPCDYSVRVVDYTNVAILDTHTYTNSEYDNFELTIDTIPTPPAHFELQVKKSIAGSQVMIKGIQIITTTSA